MSFNKLSAVANQSSVANNTLAPREALHKFLPSVMARPVWMLCKSATSVILTECGKVIVVFNSVLDSALIKVLLCSVEDAMMKSDGLTGGLTDGCR